MRNSELEYSPASDAQWQCLIEAIILSSVATYRKLRSKQRKGKELTPLEQEELQEIEKFFLGDWFAWLCDLDGAELLKQLQNETKRIKTGFALP